MGNNLIDKMKFLHCFIIILFTFSLIQTKKHNQHKKKWLPNTPKAHNLHDHYGTTQTAGFYGPGPYVEIVNQPKNVIFSRNQEHVYLGSSKDCRKEPYFMICNHIKTCDLCTVNPHCGWCRTSQTCKPGTHHYSKCSRGCPSQDWIFNKQCVHSVKSGKMTNVAPESRTVINPEVTGPKIHLHTSNHHAGMIREKRPIGYTIEKDRIAAYHHPSNQIEQHDIEVAKPVLGEVHRPVTVTQHSEKIVDLSSGKIVQTPDIGYLGIDNVHKRTASGRPVA